MRCHSIQFSGHAISRMFERDLFPKDVTAAIERGEVIAEYPEDHPYPSYLLLGFVEGEPLHVVVARDEAGSRCFVVTVYRPDPELWQPDFKTRKRT